jgi:hypothetical protein
MLFYNKDAKIRIFRESHKKKLKNLFQGKNGSTGLKTANFCKHGFLRARRKKKSPIDKKGLFRAFKLFLVLKA